MSKAYIPTPIDVSGVVLPDELNSLVESLAENVHDTWAKGRMDAGWRWGEKRDDLRKENPCLVSYDQLPEAEKEYDRSTAISTLKVIMKLGFAVQRIK